MVRIGRVMGLGGTPRVEGVPLVVPVGASLTLMRRRSRCRRGRGFLRLRLFFLLVQFLYRLDFLLQLHPPILEPDLYLSLRQTKRVSHFYPSPPRQVVIRMELLLQLECLIARIRLSTPSA